SMTVVGLDTDATPGTPIVESGSGTAGTDTLTVNNATANTYAGVLRNGSTRLLALTKGAGGTLTLTGANTYTGGTTISSGTLQVGNGGSTGSLGSGSIVDNASLVYNLNSSATMALPSGGVSGSGNLTATAGLIQFNADVTLGGSQSY